MLSGAKVLTLDEPTFASELHAVLSPSVAIRTPELLRGRDQQLTAVREALYSPGRQAFVFGFRGVGKTSLAQTAAYQLQSSDKEPIFISCTPDSTCFGLVRDIARKAFPNDPRTKSTTQKSGLSGGPKWASASNSTSETNERFERPDSLNGAIDILGYVAKNHSKTPVVVIDEFDQISDKNEQNLFANLVKQLADQGVSLKIIFCGVAEAIDQLIDSHLSAPRYFHPVSLERLPYDARNEIIIGAADHLNISIDKTTMFRIGMVSDGFPHYVHLICEKLYWRVYRDQNQGVVNGDLFEHALVDAASALQPELKKPYEKATRKYSDVREPLLWAAADGDELQRPSRDIWASYLRIVEDLERIGRLKEPALDRRRFNSLMNSLKTTSSGCILKGTRSGWYEYSEKVVRGYARLRAMQMGVILEREHPMQRRRF